MTREVSEHGNPGPASRWAAALHSWAIPERILAAAPESPWWFPVAAFVEHARVAEREPLTPTHRRAVEVLPDDGSGVLLDVGCGAGAASLPTAPPAGRVVGVDESEEMLRAFADRAGDRVGVETIAGRWPDVAHLVPTVDATVCANVLYNVADDIEAFIEALTRSARRRVIVELTEMHPMSALSPLWRHFWDLDRPIGPTAADAAAVIGDVTGEEVSIETWARASSYLDEIGPQRIAVTRRRLCLSESADDEIELLLKELPLEPATSKSVAMWWKGSAP